MIPALQSSYSTISPKELMLKVLPDYSIESPLDCVLWERGANDTYQVRCAGARYSLRIYRCGAFPREAMEFEVEALNHLHEQGASVAYPITRKSGGYLTEVVAPEGRRFVLLTAFVEGTSPSYDSVDDCRLVGASVAQMHMASDGFETAHHRPRLDLQSLLEESLAIIRPFVAHRQAKLDQIESIAANARAAVHAAPESSLDLGLCHGDLHGGNLHVHEGKVTHFDFEECAFGTRVYDLATFKWGACIGEERAKRWPAFLEGYESVRPMPAVDASLVDTYVVVRDLSNIGFGMRNVQDFGHELASDGEIDHLCKRLRELADLAGH